MSSPEWSFQGFTDIKALEDYIRARQHTIIQRPVAEEAFELLANDDSDSDDDFDEYADKFSCDYMFDKPVRQFTWPGPSPPTKLQDMRVRNLFRSNRDAISKDPEVEKHVKEIQKTLFDVGKYDEAILRCDECIVETPHADLYLIKARCNLMLLKYEEALHDCSIASKLDPLYDVPYLIKAIAKKYLRDIFGVRYELSGALTLNPFNKVAMADYHGLGSDVQEIYLRRNEDEKKKNDSKK